MSRKSKGFNKPKPTPRQQRKRVLQYHATRVNADGEDISSNRARKRLAKGDY